MYDEVELFYNLLEGIYIELLNEKIDKYIIKRLVKYEGKKYYLVERILLLNKRLRNNNLNG